jgi:hypothetical protein
MAAPDVQFSYCDMYNFYRGFGEITNDVFELASPLRRT